MANRIPNSFVIILLAGLNVRFDMGMEIIITILFGIAVDDTNQTSIYLYMIQLCKTNHSVSIRRVAKLSFCGFSHMYAYKKSHELFVSIKKATHSILVGLSCSD
jgi:hypothetical protein